jgi:hypothetical protein
MQTTTETAQSTEQCSLQSCKAGFYVVMQRLHLRVQQVAYQLDHRCIHCLECIAVVTRLPVCLYSESNFQCIWVQLEISIHLLLFKNHLKYLISLKLRIYVPKVWKRFLNTHVTIYKIFYQSVCPSLLRISFWLAKRDALMFNILSNNQTLKPAFLWCNHLSAVHDSIAADMVSFTPRN